MLYLDMFLTFVKIGLFSFGGGYAILAMIQQEVVIRHAWLTQQQFVDVVAISQMTPGPIAINAATFIGYQKGGILGSALCTLGVILPSLIIMTVITITYLKLRQQAWFRNVFAQLRLLSLGLIAAALVLIAGSAFTDVFTIVVFIFSLLAMVRFKLNPFVLLLLAGAAGIIFG